MNPPQPQMSGLIELVCPQASLTLAAGRIASVSGVNEQRTLRQPSRLARMAFKHSERPMRSRSAAEANAEALSWLCKTQALNTMPQIMHCFEDLRVRWCGCGKSTGLWPRIVAQRCAAISLVRASTAPCEASSGSMKLRLGRENPGKRNINQNDNIVKAVHKSWHPIR